MKQKIEGLSLKEKALWEVLSDKEPIALDDIIARYPGENRHSVYTRIKYLAAKLAPMGWIISQTGGIGRGKKAIYKVEKKF